MTAANLPQVTGVLALAGLVVLFPSPPTGESGEWGGVAEAGPCPKGMVSIRDKFCIDAYEAHTVEVDKPRTSKRAPKRGKSHSPFKPIGSAHVMAVSEKGKIPQGHISRDQAEQACINAGKRLCTDDEWLDACRGKKPTKFPYGDQHAEGRCNDRGVSGFNLLFGPGNNTAGRVGLHEGEHERPSAEPGRGLGHSRPARFPEVQERLQGLRHGRQPPRVDSATPRARFGAAITSTPRSTARAATTGPRPTTRSTTTTRRASGAAKGRRAEADRQARQGARQVGEERQVRQGG
ncbi:MAG: SUMF1/EgtB/PvdO family nonheme iron enzyme [Polyangiaceae bacterium]|nr:SUMF1/EgtB/PvdO family nonheme iron enzyme [Polyangiaceae bacterium]